MTQFAVIEYDHATLVVSDEPHDDWLEGLTHEIWEYWLGCPDTFYVTFVDRILAIDNVRTPEEAIHKLHQMDVPNVPPNRVSSYDITAEDITMLAVEDDDLGDVTTRTMERFFREEIYNKTVYVMMKRNAI